jgi:hypothetical protein
MGATGQGKVGRVNRVNLRGCFVMKSLADGLFERGVGAEPPKSGRRRSRTSYRPGEYRRPRDTGGTLPGRISHVWNVVTPSGSGHECCAR